MKSNQVHNKVQHKDHSLAAVAVQTASNWISSIMSQSALVHEPKNKSPYSTIGRIKPK